jgi:hypothetical protein
VLAIDWPGNFFAGDGVGRAYIDETATADQRRELEAIFMAKKGGIPEAVLRAVVPKWLPVQFMSVDISWGDAPSVKVGDVGQGQLTPFADADGNPTMLDSALGPSAFQLKQMRLASGKGGQWCDPDLRSWDGDSAAFHKFAWNG